MLPSFQYLLFAHDFFHPLNDVRRLINDFFRQCFQPFAANRSDFPLPLIRLDEKFRIFKHLEYTLRAAALTRSAGIPGRRQDRPAKSAGTEHDPRQTFLASVPFS